MDRKGHPSNQRDEAAWAAGCFAWLVILLLLSGGGYWGYQEWQGRQETEVTETETGRELQNHLDDALEKRRLDEAEALVERMAETGVEPEIVAGARARVEQGRAEEKGQEIAFLALNARSALEAGRLSEAERFCSQIEKLEANHPVVREVRGAVEKGRKEARIDLITKAIGQALAKEDWATAEGQLKTLGQEIPNDQRVREFRVSLSKAKEEARQRRARAAGLVQQARALDDGTYSEEAMRLLAEAIRLHPSAENRAVYRKMSAYGKVIRVPGEHDTIAAALKVAEANDRIMVDEGTFYESLQIPDGVTLVGASGGETVIECPAKDGAVVTVSPGAGSVRLTSLTLRHSGLASEEERFPILAVNGGEVEGENLKVIRASGHGVAVLNGGKVRLRRCQIIDSGWDGVAAMGDGSIVELSEVKSQKNLHHGVDFWEGASGTVSDSVLSENGLNGFLSIGGARAIKVTNTRCQKNREVGLFVSGGVGLTLENCQVQENLLGGIFVGGGARKVSWSGNRVAGNGEVGVVFEKGVDLVSEEANVVEGNDGRQIWRDADFPGRPGEESSPPPPAPPLETTE